MTLNYCLPIASYNTELISDNSESVVKSPRLAAMGVATLSGFILNFVDNKTTITITAPTKKSWSVSL